MRALISREPGGPETLKMTEVATPVARQGQVLIEIKACGVNYPDVLTIQDKYQVKAPRPFSPGAEVAGVVVAVGPGVSDFEIGQKVVARTGTGGMAEYIAVGVDRCNHMPNGIPFEDAAVMQFTFETAYYALVTRARIKHGESVLVLGAGGGVGSAAVQIARNLGAIVVAAASSERKVAFAREVGADKNFIYPQNEPEDKRAVVAALRDSLGQQGANIVVDPVGGWLSEPAFRCLAEDGRFLVLGFTAGIASLPMNLPLLKNGDVMGINWRTFTLQQRERAVANKAILERWYREGRLSPGISAKFPLEEGGQAIKLVADRRVVGKVVVTMP